MRRATVSDVMTRDVVTVDPGTGIKNIVRALSGRGISGVPVIGPGGRVIGVVSESDILRKEQFTSPAEGDASLLETRRHQMARVRAAGAVAAEVMSTPVVTVTMETTVVDATRLLDERGITRLPVLDPRGRLAGIVTRADLIRVFLRDDDEIRTEILNGVIRRYYAENIELVDVDDGVVCLRGRLDRDDLIPAVVRLTSAVEGVVRVVNKLTVAEDTTA